MSVDITNISTKDIIPYINNAKKHPAEQIDKIASSIKNYGFTVPVVVDGQNEIIMGHGRLLAAKKLGLEEIPCIVRDDLTPSQVKALRIADNKVSESEWDVELLLAEIDGLDDFTGFDLDEIKELQFEFNGPDEIIEDEVPEPPEEPKSKLGDLYILGRHRLLCGDSTKAEDVEMLMDGKKADLLLTDPPYNIGFEYSEYGDNKTADDYKTFLYMSIYGVDVKNKIVTTGKRNIAVAHELADVTDMGIWYSPNKMSGGKISNLSLWEPIIFIGEYDRNTRANDVFEYTNEVQKDTGEHTCPKTVKLFTELLRYSAAGATILDTFLGSGTTLIACEQTGRSCYGMELDPKYCDVIVERWENLTGQKAELVGE